MAAVGSLCADPPEKFPCAYVVDPRPIGKTPKYLGVNIEVMDHFDRCNLWDWLADSGAGMARVFHPPKNLRKTPATEATYRDIATHKNFDSFRSHLGADPEHNVPWGNYCFSESVPWLGVPDGIVQKLQEISVAPILSMDYLPSHFPRPLLKNFTDKIQPADEDVDWAAAASAYEYYFATIYRYSARNGVCHYMLLNEPSNDQKYIPQVGIMARLARLALEDVRAKLPDKTTAAALRLSGPALYAFWEEYWPYVEPYVDFLDVHLYEPDAAILERKARRAASRARLSGKPWVLTEFNRVGGPMPPEQSLFSIKPSLEVADLLMSVFSSSRPEDPGCEFALFYQFQFPATHRNYKSLVYGDMNLVDWTGQDKPLSGLSKALYPTFDELQLRFPTLAYHMFKMFARCVPGARNATDAFEVYELGEGNRGVSAVSDPVNHRNVYPKLEREKYYARGGGGSELRCVGVRGGDRFYILLLNPGPATVKEVGFDLTALHGSYATAIVRETSLFRRDQPTVQIELSRQPVRLDVPPESLTQIIFTREDLGKVEELKIEEQTATPGTSAGLKKLETTRLRLLGRIAETWLDITDLNVVWGSSAPDFTKVYQGGLVQVLRDGGEEALITAKTLNGVAASKKISLSGSR
jgi:hypothetical protein